MSPTSQVVKGPAGEVSKVCLTLITLKGSHSFLAQSHTIIYLTYQLLKQMLTELVLYFYKC